MEPNGIFLNRIFQTTEKTTKGKVDLEQKKEDLLIDNSPTKELQSTAHMPFPQKNFAKSFKKLDDMTRSSSSTYISHLSGRRLQEPLQKPGSTMMTMDWVEDGKNSSQSSRHEQRRAYNNSVQQQQHRSKNKRPSSSSSSSSQNAGKNEERGDDAAHYVNFEEDNNNNVCNQNNNNYSINTTTSTVMSSSPSVSPFVEDSVKTTKKSKSGVRRNSNLNKTFDKSCGQEDREEQGLFDKSKSTSSFTSPSSLLTWKLPSFLCLPFTNNDANNSYLHLMNTSTKSSGILSLTSLILVVMAVLLASVPAPVMSVAATETGESSSVVVTDEITNNDVTPHDYLTTSSSILPVKLQTISFTSHEGTTPEDSALFSSAATGRTTGGGTGPSVTHQSVEGIRQEPTMNDFAGWRDADSLTTHSGEVENSSNKGLQEDTLLHKEYEFKSGYPELLNETREALQEEGSDNRPVVFVGGSGYVPPNSLRTRPSLDADPLWQARPLAESRYPVPLQSAWDRNYRNPFNMTRVQHIEAECQDDFMKIRVAMNGSFHGLIYSSGYSYDPDCVYVNGTGRDYYEYLIKLNRCGTLGASNHVEGRREPSKNFMWNTVTVQYNPMIEEEWDEHFKVTCEYGYDFWKTVTFPFLDVEVATGNPVVFTLTPPECYMEVRYGFGTAGTRVGGPVRVGDPLTLMINMRSQYDGFDIVVNDCYAHNGATKRIQLIDHYGCPVDSKLMSPFRGTWSHTNLYETQVYAYLKTFRFTGSPALYIECDVRMCHGQCPSQPCYWRNVKSVSKRSTDNQMITDSEKNSTLSEKTSLFQALRVLQEDEDSEALKTTLEPNESVCMKTGAFTAMIALSTFILVILTVSTMIMCFRIRRGKVIEERETAADILRPYSHHVTQHAAQPQHQRHHHWSSVKPR